MITRTRVIGTQFPELSESAHFLQERIQSYMQLTDSLGSPLVEVPRIVPQTRKSPSVESLEIQITPDTQKIVHFLTTYLTWITRVGSSTNDTKTGSK